MIRFICISDNIKTPKLRYIVHSIFVLISFIFKYSGWVISPLIVHVKHIMNAKISIYVTFYDC